MKLAMMGCGNIANFHAPALKKAGFDIISVAGSNNSSTVADFAHNHGIPKIFSNPVELVESDEWDALLIASPIGTVIDYIHRAAIKRKPILCEKPISLDYTDLDELIKYDNIYVAYNRRYYSTVQYAKEFLQENPQALLKVTIPESDDSYHGYNKFPDRLPSLTYENSVHVIDTLNYLAGKVQWSKTEHVLSGDEYVSVTALGKGEYGFNVVLDIYYSTPANFSIDILARDERLELRPIEIATHYKGMEVNEPTKDIPIRTYSPTSIRKIIESSKISGLKPGFYEQAEDFMKACNGENGIKAANIINARDALEVVHMLR